MKMIPELPLTPNPVPQSWEAIAREAEQTLWMMIAPAIGHKELFYRNKALALILSAIQKACGPVKHDETEEHRLKEQLELAYRDVAVQREILVKCEVANQQLCEVLVGLEPPWEVVARLRRQLAAAEQRTQLEARVLDDRMLQLLKIESQLSERDAQIVQLREALEILLRSRDCWNNGECEIREELSGQFDITLPQADLIIAAVRAALSTPYKNISDN